MGRTICDVYGMEAGKELPAEEFIVKFLKGGWQEGWNCTESFIPDHQCLLSSLGLGKERRQID